MSEWVSHGVKYTSHECDAGRDLIVERNPGYSIKVLAAMIEWPIWDHEDKEWTFGTDYNGIVVLCCPYCGVKLEAGKEDSTPS